ncbi:MAG: uracil-DNA glycosylase [Oceanihabitans sp.]
MNLNLNNSWRNILKKEFDKQYFKDLLVFINKEYKEHTCFPEINAIFNAFNFCDFNKIKVVIIGQDPYHDIGQANGLCFSVNKGVKQPPSLKNIFKELENDVLKPYPENGNLENWANQGVLLLNATLTVRAHQAGSHQNKGWETFTNAVIQHISESRKDIVFLLWGGFAKKKAKLIDANKHHILVSGHPSPLSANRGYWFGNKHFSKTNFLLEQVGLQPVVW